jgi:hypothetical protein
MTIRRHWEAPPPELLTDPVFEAIWTTIKTWDITVPDAYGGHCEATQNHVFAIFKAIRAALTQPALEKGGE